MFGFLGQLRANRQYRQAYARCCSVQQREFGWQSLSLLSYESVFLYQLAVDAKAIPGPDADWPLCCRLRASGRLNHSADAGVARFCGAVGLLLASTKLEDDIRDGGSVLARMARWRLTRPIAKAHATLQTLDPEFPAPVEAAIRRHLALERTDRPLSLGAYCEPTATAFGYVFGLLAKLPSHRQELDHAVLVALGRHIGTAIIAYDCAVDWRSDRRRGEFNPLADEQSLEEALHESRHHLEQAGWLCQRAFGGGALTAWLLKTRFDRIPTNPPDDPRTGILERWGLSPQPRSVYLGMDCPGGDCDCCSDGCDCHDCPFCMQPCPSEKSERGDEGEDATDRCMDRVRSTQSESDNPIGAFCLAPFLAFCDCCDYFCHPSKKRPAQAPSAKPTPALAGQTGEAVTPLRPSGKVRIAGKLYSAQAEASMISNGATVVVVDQGPFGLIVREAGTPEASDSANDG